MKIHLDIVNTVNLVLALGVSCPVAGLCFEVDGFGFFEVDESHVLVSSYSGSDEKVVFPSHCVHDYYEWEQDLNWEYHYVHHRDEYSVIGIADGAFNGATFSAFEIPSSYTTIGDGAFCNCSRIQQVDLPLCIRDIGTGSFQNCNALRTVSIPTSVTNIGSSAFSYCDNLTFVSTPLISTNQWGWCNSAFDHCPELGNLDVWCSAEGQTVSRLVAVSDQITNLTLHGIVAGGVCSSMRNLKTIHLPSGCAKIGDSAFSGCNRLSDIDIPNTVQHIGYNAFGYCDSLERIELPEGLQDVGGHAFGYCSSLREITIPATLKAVGNPSCAGAFSGCSVERVYITDLSAWCRIDFGEKHWWSNDKEYNAGNNPLQTGGALILNGNRITKLVIPDDITEILTGTFYGCDVSNVVFHGSVKKICSYAFCECTNLTAVVVPDAVEKIGDNAFAECLNLRSFRFPMNIEVMPYGVLADCESLVDVVFPKKISRIADYAFYMCTSLKEVKFPDSVTEIGYYAFEGCTSLSRLPNLNHVTDIYGGAFMECSSISEVVIPESVAFLDEEVFRSCSSITSVVINAKLSEFNWGVFSECDEIRHLTLPPCDVYIGIAEVFDEELCTLESITFRGKLTYDEWPFPRCDKLTDLSVCDLSILGCLPNPSGIRRLEVSEEVSTIKRSDVSMLSGLNEIVVSGSSSLEEDCFARMPALETVSLSAQPTTMGNGCFANCEKLSSVTLGEDVHDIGENMFAECVSLKEIDLSAAMMIRQNAFMFCTNLESVAFSGCVVIGDNAFDSCTSLKEIDLSTVQTIMDKSFANCTSLKKLVIPAELEVFGDEAFAGCRYLEELKIEYRDAYDSTVSNLFGLAGGGCDVFPKKVELGFFPNGMSADGIEELTVVEGTTAGSDRLYTPASAKKVNLPASLVDVKKLAIGGPKYTVAEANTKYAHDDNRSLRSKDGTEMLGWANVSSRWYGGAFGETPGRLDYVCKIGDRAFQNCDKLRYLDFDSHIKSVGKEAFKGLPNLEVVSFGCTISSIGDSAFEDCTKLRIVNPFPKSLSALGKRAFANCASSGIYMFEGKPPKVSATNSTQYVFAGSQGQGQGEYFYKYYDAWTNKVGKLGQWQGLYWFCAATNAVEYKFGNLTPAMRAICDRMMDESGFIAGESSAAELAEGTTEKDIVESSLLGVEPTLVTVDDTVYFSTDASFAIEDFLIDTEQKTATLRVAVTTENGQIPASFALNGIPDIQVKEALSDEWRDLCIGESFEVEDVGDQKAVMSVTVDLSNYKFFRAKVD